MLLLNNAASVLPVALQKRCKFTQAAVEAAGLTNVRVHCARAELAGGSIVAEHATPLARVLLGVWTGSWQAVRGVRKGGSHLRFVARCILAPDVSIY